MKIKRWFASLWLALLSGSAYAVAIPPRPLSEPGILELLGIGAVVALVAAIRRHRK
jgi:hypothetical protein